MLEQPAPMNLEYLGQMILDPFGSIWIGMVSSNSMALWFEWMDGSIRFGYGRAKLEPGVHVAIAHLESSPIVASVQNLDCGYCAPLANTETFDPVEALQVRFVVVR